jgi:hypothetical protein
LANRVRVAAAIRGIIFCKYKFQTSICKLYGLLLDLNYFK